MSTLTNAAVSRNLTQPEWEFVYAVEEAIRARYADRIKVADSAKSRAERAHASAIEQTYMNPRYRELRTMDLTRADSELAHGVRKEQAELEKPIREAEEARKKAVDAVDDLNIESETEALGGCFMAGELNGFRLGLQVFATLLTRPEKWDLAPDMPPTAVVASLLTDSEYCSRILAKLMAEPEATPAQQSAS